MEGMPDTIYGNVDAKTARRIVQNHILEKKLVDGHVFDRPSRDILKET
jgi:NADP-reducing hydrogenase subunit HndB